jgi:hypothetical protein
MSAALDSLNLRPQEKRIIVIIAVVVFIVLNLVLVVPRFKEYGSIQKNLAATRLNIANYNAYIAKDTNAGGFREQLERLQKQPEGVVSPKEIQLEQTVDAVARSCSVFIVSRNNVASQSLGPASQSDKFFERQSIRITAQASEDALVKFLYEVGNDPAMIRVWELQLNPLEPAQRYRLNASITLIADYQKAVVTNTPLAKPAVLPKTTNQAPTSAPRKAGAPPAAANVNPAPVKKAAAPSPAPPAFPPAPARSAGPPAAGQSNGPSVPSRTPRTPLQKKDVDD